MTSAQELAQDIGKTATLKVAGTSLTFQVTIMDARKRYGNLDYKVRPIAGDGEAWHQSTAIMFDSEHTFDEQVFGSGLTTGKGEGV